MKNLKYKKGEKVLYLGQKAVIRSINLDLYGKTTFSIKYKNKVNGSTTSVPHANITDLEKSI